MRVKELLEYTLPVKFFESLIYPTFSIIIVKQTNSSALLGAFMAFYTTTTILLSFYLKKTKKILKEVLVKSSSLLFLTILILYTKILYLLPIAAVLFIYAILNHYFAIYENYKDQKTLSTFEMFINLSWFCGNVFGFFFLSKMSIDDLYKFLLFIIFLFFVYTVVVVKREGVLVYIKEVADKIEKVEEKVISYIPKIVYDHKPKLHPHLTLKYPSDIKHLVASTTLFTVASSSVLVNVIYLVITHLGKPYIYLMYMVGNICGTTMFYLFRKHLNEKVYKSAITTRIIHPMFLLLLPINPLLFLIVFRIYASITWTSFYMYQNMYLVKRNREKDVASLYGFRNLGSIMGNFIGGILFSINALLVILFYYFVYSFVIYLEVFKTRKRH